MTKKTWIIFVAVVVLLLGGMIYLSNKDKSSADVSGVKTTDVLPAVAGSGNIGDHVFGQPKSKVMLVEYGDYQCPGCGSAYPIIKSLTEKYQGQLTFVFRNFPLTSVHPNALVAAAAAESAGLQGKYWEMHNKLYETQADWRSLTGDQRNSYFHSLASQLGLNTDQFKSDFEGHAVSHKISYDRELGKKDNVQGTPTFFLNGQELKQYVKDGKIVPAGTNGANPIWSDASALDTLVLQPAFKQAGIALPAAGTTAQ